MTESERAITEVFRQLAGLAKSLTVGEPRVSVELDRATYDALVAHMFEPQHRVGTRTIDMLLSGVTVRPALAAADIDNLKMIRRAVNRTAYHGGLGLRESGRFLATLNRLLAGFGVDPDDGPSLDEVKAAHSIPERPDPFPVDAAQDFIDTRGER